MFQFCVFLGLAVVAVYGDEPSPPAPPQGVYCGYTPDQIFRCLKNPKVISNEVSSKCEKSDTECDKMTCIFRQSLWLSLDGTLVDKKKISAHFDQFAKDHPEWTAAVAHLKLACLERDLPPQGVTLNCPAYDIMHCIFSSFIRNATPSQWSTSKDCLYPQQYATACPICPTSCFASTVPYGSCNACMSLPRTP